MNFGTSMQFSYCADGSFHRNQIAVTVKWQSSQAGRRERSLSFRGCTSGQNCSDVQGGNKSKP